MEIFDHVVRHQQQNNLVRELESELLDEYHINRGCKTSLN